jgi:hypothetical protein
MEKICAHCKNCLDTSLFFTHKQSKDGFGSWCKPCLKERRIKKSREAGIEPKRVGIDPVKRKISNLNYRKRKAETFVHTIAEKICSHCNTNKTVDCYRKNITYKDGYNNKCKKCEYEICTDSRNAYELKHWAKRLFLHAKKHSKYDFDIDEQFVSELYEKQKGKCFWFNVDLKPSNIAKYPWQPSLDRLDREKGYTKDNVVLACYSANIGRNTSDEATFSLFVEDLKMALQDNLEFEKKF